jgi:hypothetical protein
MYDVWCGVVWWWRENKQKYETLKMVIEDVCDDQILQKIKNKVVIYSYRVI